MELKLEATSASWTNPPHHCIALFYKEGLGADQGNQRCFTQELSVQGQQDLANLFILTNQPASLVLWGCEVNLILISLTNRERATQCLNWVNVKKKIKRLSCLSPHPPCLLSPWAQHSTRHILDWLTDGCGQNLRFGKPPRSSVMMQGLKVTAPYPQPHFVQKQHFISRHSWKHLLCFESVNYFWSVRKCIQTEVEIFRPFATHF